MGPVVDGEGSSELHLSLVVAGELREMVLPRPPPLRSEIEAALRWRTRAPAAPRTSPPETGPS